MIEDYGTKNRGFKMPHIVILGVGTGRMPAAYEMKDAVDKKIQLR